MTTIRGILIPADESEPVQLIEVVKGDYKSFQQHVGGLFDLVRLETPPATFFIHDEGKILQKPLNRRASLMTWASNPNWRHADVLVGDCLLMGPADEEGETLGVPDEFVQLLFHTERFKYEVQVYDEEGWHGNQLTYPDWVDAYNYGVSLADRWLKVTTVRVVAA